MALSLSRSAPAYASVQWKRAVFPVGLLLLCGLSLHRYFHGSSALLLAGCAAVAFTAQKRRPVRKNRFAIAVLMTVGLTWLVPVNTLLYFAFALTLFYWIEVYYAAIHFLGLVALLISSPAFQSFSGVFSFPLRMQLTRMVAVLFSLAGSGIKFNGNVLSFGGNEFSVDPACAGLHMFSLSLLLGIGLLGALQHKAGTQLRWQMILLYLACLCLLNFFSNVLRIVLLVQFAVLPDNVLHDAIGLACLLLYVCLPAGYIAKAFVSKAAHKGTTASYSTQAASASTLWLLLAALSITAQRVATVDTYASFEAAYAKKVDGFASSVQAPGIVKLQSEKALVYVKFLRGFYDTEHNPTMCWRGSGYVFKEAARQSIAGTEVYTARLQKAGNVLYTAWWYGNGESATASQQEWRWAMLRRGEAYAVINVTASTESRLENEVKRILQEQILSPLFTK